MGEAHVQLERGGSAYVRPWGIRTGRRMMKRIRTMVTVGASAARGNLDLGLLLEASYDEIVGLVADTINVPVDDLMDDDGKYTLADFMAILEAIIRVNFVERPGLVKNLEGLFATASRLIEGGEADEASPTTGMPRPPDTNS